MHATASSSFRPGAVARSSLLCSIGVFFGISSAFAQSINPAQALEQATKLQKQIEAVTGSKPSNTPVPAGDPCAIVPAAEVKKVFPTAAATPARSRRLEQYGITECVWKDAKGAILLGVQESRSNSPQSARDEAGGMAMGMTEPFNPKVRDPVRIEKLAELKLDNAAFAETADPARSILSDGAFLALVKGPQLVTLMAPDLPRRGRGEALKALESLGAAAEKSMK